MKKIADVKGYFPLVREIALPVSGVGWAYLYLLHLLDVEPNVLVSYLAFGCIFIGIVVITFEAALVELRAVPLLTIQYVVTILEPVVYSYCIFAVCVSWGQLAVKTSLGEALRSVAVVAIINALFIIQQVSFGWYVGYINRKYS